MPGWEYKTLVYGLEGKGFYSERFWTEPVISKELPPKAYGPKVRSRLIGKMHTAMHQLQQVLEELDRDGWELVSTSFFMAGIFNLHGTAVLRKPRE